MNEFVTASESRTVTVHEIFNINTFVKTMNYLMRYSLKTPEDFKSYCNQFNLDFDLIKTSQKKLDLEMLDMREKLKFTMNYRNNRSVYFQSLKAKNKEEFYHNHREELIQYNAALIYFEKNTIDPKSQNLNFLFQEYEKLKVEKNHLKSQLQEFKEKKYELETVKKYRMHLEYSAG